ncbi:STAS-like domain-containing protein, partial [Candidatus Berkelbacteria bacterium]|nr:STAS-like domain-containing protein [Candidatus Berkelbacteria bacterium]
VGQGFTDEIFRVFKTRHPHIKITPVNMNESVEFMVKRAKGNK